MKSMHLSLNQGQPMKMKGGRATLLLDSALSVVHGTPEFFAMLDLESPLESSPLPSFASYLAQEDQMMFQALTNKVPAEHTLIELSFRLQDKNKRPISFYGHHVMLDHERQGLSGIFLDFSPLEQAQHKLKESHQEMQSISNAMDAVVAKIRLDPAYTILYTNEEFYRFFEQPLVKSDALPSARGLVYASDLPRLEKTIREQLQSQGKISIEFRVQRSVDLQPKWVYVRANPIGMDQGYPVVLGVFMDISELKATQLELQLEQERHRILASLSHDILFDYNLQNDVLTYTNPHQSLLPKRQVIEHFLSNDAAKNFVHPDDYHFVEELVKDIRKGNTSASYVLRILQTDHRYYWYLAYLMAVSTNVDAPTLVMGKLVDIHREKEKEVALRQELQHDPLTKLYNQIAIKNLVESVLVNRPTDRHMLFILDIDNFKQANDQYGHLFGNAVLVEIANTLRQVFRKSDLIGRIGGDEFLIWLGHIQSQTEATLLAEKLADRLRSAVIQPHEDYSISLSIGFATYPDNGITYEELFMAADFALYHSKRTGKDRIEGATIPSKKNETLK